MPTPHNDADVTFVRDYLNTLDLDPDAETDELSTPDELADWLRARDRIGPGDAAGPADLELARELRAALRDEAQAHHGRAGEAAVDPAVRRRLDDVAARLPLRVVFTAGADPAVVPAATGVRAGLAAVLAAVAGLAATGDWQRLKICPDDSCRWAFFDESRNRSRRWCSMEVCGNRTKVRTFRERHQPS